MDTYLIFLKYNFIYKIILKINKQIIELALLKINHEYNLNDGT